jgi:hypothetical protein
MEKRASQGLSMAGSKFSCLTDNTTTEGAANNRKSRDFWVNREWRVVQDMLIKLDCDINLVRVTSEDNEADKLLRGLDPSKDLQNMIKITIPDDLKPLLTQVIPTPKSQDVVRQEDSLTIESWGL